MEMADSDKGSKTELLSIEIFAQLESLVTKNDISEDVSFGFQLVIASFFLFHMK